MSPTSALSKYSLFSLFISALISVASFFIVNPIVSVVSVSSFGSSFSSLSSTKTLFTIVPFTISTFAFTSNVIVSPAFTDTFVNSVALCLDNSSGNLSVISKLFKSTLPAL